MDCRWHFKVLMIWLKNIFFWNEWKILSLEDHKIIELTLKLRPVGMSGKSFFGCWILFSWIWFMSALLKVCFGTTPSNVWSKLLFSKLLMKLYSSPLWTSTFRSIFKPFFKRGNQCVRYLLLRRELKRKNPWWHVLPCRCFPEVRRCPDNDLKIVYVGMETNPNTALNK